MRSLMLFIATLMTAAPFVSSAGEVVNVPLKRDLSNADFRDFEVGDQLTLPDGYTFTLGNDFKWTKDFKHKYHRISRDCYAVLYPGSAPVETVVKGSMQFDVVEVDHKESKFLKLESVDPVGENNSKLGLTINCTIIPPQKYGFFTGDMYWHSNGVAEAAKYLGKEGITFQPKTKSINHPIEVIGNPQGGSDGSPGAGR
jgi:hypothetical protein